MASNIAIGAVNLVDLVDTTVECANEDGDAPASRLQEPEISDVFRTVDLNAGTSKIMVTLGSERTFADFAIGIVKPNWTSAATWQAVLKNAAAVTMLDTGALNANVYGWQTDQVDEQWRNIAVYPRIGASSILVKTIEITQTDGANSDGYFEIARLFVGPLIVPELGIAYDWSPPDYEDPSERAEAAGGNLVHRRRRKRKVFSATLKRLTEAEGHDSFVETLNRTAGKTGDCLVIPMPPAAFPSSASRLNGRLLWGPQNEVGALSNPAFRRYSRPLSFRERT